MFDNIKHKLIFIITNISIMTLGHDNVICESSNILYSSEFKREGDWGSQHDMFNNITLK